MRRFFVPFILIAAISLIISIVLSCISNSNTKPDATGKDWATLVAYKTSGKHKRSVAYLQLNHSKTIHEYYLGRRLDPDMKLGDSIMTNWEVYGDRIEIKSAFIKVKPYQGRGFYSLPQFDYLN